MWRSRSGVGVSVGEREEEREEEWLLELGVVGSSI